MYDYFSRRVEDVLARLGRRLRQRRAGSWSAGGWRGRLAASSPSTPGRRPLHHRGRAGSQGRRWCAAGVLRSGALTYILLWARREHGRLEAQGPLAHPNSAHRDGGRVPDSEERPVHPPYLASAGAAAEGAQPRVLPGLRALKDAGAMAVVRRADRAWVVAQQEGAAYPEHGHRAPDRGRPGSPPAVRGAARRRSGRAARSARAGTS